MQVLNGRFGPYLSDGKLNGKIPKDREPASLTLEEVVKLMGETGKPVRKGFGAKKAVVKKSAVKKSTEPKPAKAPAKKAATKKTAAKKNRDQTGRQEGAGQESREEDGGQEGRLNRAARPPSKRGVR